MPQYKILSLDVEASYNQIDSTYSGRLTPQAISIMVYESEVASILDVAGLLEDIQSEPIEVENMEAAKAAARTKLTDKLNNFSSGVQLALDPAIFYRPGTGGIHEMMMFMLKVNGKSNAPWAFSIVHQGKTIDGYVGLSMLLGPAVATARSAGTAGQVRDTVTKPKSVAAAPSRSGGAPAPRESTVETSH